GHLVGGGEAVGGGGGAGPGQEAPQAVLLDQHLVVAAARQPVAVGLLPGRPVEDQHGQRPADRVEVAGDGRAGDRHLGRLVAGRAEDGSVGVVEPAHAAEVDQLHRVADVDHVVGLEVAVDQAPLVQVVEGGQHRRQVGGRV